MTDNTKSIRTSILHIGKFYPPHSGGMETHLRDLAVRQVPFASVSVIVANSFRRHEQSVVDGISLTRVARLGTIASMPICPGLTDAIRHRPADLVHIHTPNPGAAFSFLMSGHRGKLVITHHADTLGRKELRRLSDPFVCRVMQRACAIIVTSARYLASSEELQPFREKCRIIPLGIEPPPARQCDQALPPNLHRTSGAPLILAIGRLVPYKGFDVLIRAMKQVDADLLLIGSGPEALRLESLAEREGVRQKLRMLGRVDDLRPYFHAASLFVLPSVSRAEAFGIVQMEAMAAELPVVNTNLDSGVPEVSVHGETGLTIEPGDPLALARAITILLEDEDLRKGLGKAARARVLAEFTADLMAQRTVGLYREVLEIS